MKKIIEMTLKKVAVVLTLIASLTIAGKIYLVKWNANVELCYVHIQCNDCNLEYSTYALCEYKYNDTSDNVFTFVYEIPFSREYDYPKKTYLRVKETGNITCYAEITYCDSGKTGHHNYDTVWDYLF
jgi:uncharacterized protein YxeA